MNKPLDPYILALSNWEHVEYLRYLFFLMFFVGAIGFLFYWFLALKVWISGLRDAWKNKRGLFWMNDPRNPFVQRFLAVLLKGFFVWLIAGWPLMLMLTGLASAEAFNILLGYDAISGPE